MSDNPPENSASPDSQAQKQPLVFSLKRNCLDDGPGIRTTVFFKGCPLSCAWCHNPESKKPTAELSFDPLACIGCGDCIRACPNGALSKDNPRFVDRSLCRLCFNCVEACPARAMTRMGTPMGIQEIMAVINRDLPFFMTSGGGVTLSGGEPTLFMEFCSELLRSCKKAGVNTLLETSGHFDSGRFETLMLPWLDQVYVDIKLIDPDEHRKYCGVGNGIILDNIRKLGELSRDGAFGLLPRVPLAPGITDLEANLAGIADFLKSLGIGKIALLAYNPTWTRKPAMLGGECAFERREFMSREQISRCRSFFTDFEITA